MAAIKTALAGISVSGEHEPSHGLLDRMCAIYDQNCLTYPDLSSCASRALEIQGTVKSKEITLGKGSLVLKSGDEKLTAPTVSEIKVHVVCAAC